MKVGDLLKFLNNYDEDTEVEFSLVGEGYLSVITVTDQGGPEMNPDAPDYHWPLILVDW